LETLLASVSTIRPEAVALSNAAKRLTDYGIDVRYPGARPNAEEARQALADCTAIRLLLRSLLDLPR
jgi:hypothetical protein